MGYVPQKGVLFSGDIASNIKFGGEDINDEKMEEAAQIAQAVEFIESKPDGYHSPISQGGTKCIGRTKAAAFHSKGDCKESEGIFV